MSLFYCYNVANKLNVINVFDFQERNLTQVLNNSVSLNNLDISPRHFNSSTIAKSKEFSTPVKSASESAVLQNSNSKINRSKNSISSGVELIIENQNPDPVCIYF